MDEMNKPASRVEAILQRMLGADTNIEKPASRVEFLLSNVKDLLLAVEDEVEKLEGKTTRLLYSDKTNPTAQEIDAFAIEKGYESPYEGVAVVVSGTYHIWHFYENDNIGWRDDGVDTIAPFTNSVPGSILGSTDDGKIGANLDGTGSVNGLPVIKSVGRSSVKTITENVEGDVDRTNTVNGPFSVAFGSRNFIGVLASESGAFGGDIHILSENTYGFGYHVWAHQNQNLIGGYDVGSNAKETMIFGNTIGVDCSHNSQTHKWTPNGTSSGDLSKYLMIFGDHHYVGAKAKGDLIVGSGHTIGTSFRYSLVSGNGTNIGNDVEYVNVFGGSNNELFDNLTDCTIFGYYQKVYGGSASNSKKNNIYMMGHNNSNSKNNTVANAKTDVYLFGSHLCPLENGQFIVGDYNKISSNDKPNAYFLVGTGGSENSRRTSFAVCYNETYGHHMYLGDARLTPPSGNGTIATEEYVSNIVGDINSALDAINGRVI